MRSFIFFNLLLIVYGQFSQLANFNQATNSFDIQDYDYDILNTVFLDSSNLLFFINIADTFKLKSLNFSSNTFTSINLQVPRYYISGASLSNYGLAFFAGGVQPESEGTSNIINVFNATNNSWSIAYLSQGRKSIFSFSLEELGLVIFAGGEISVTSGLNTNVIDIYNAKNNSWNNIILPYTASNTIFFGTASGLSNIGLLFFPIYRLLPSNTTLYIYDLNSNITSNITISGKLCKSSATYNKTLLLLCDYSSILFYDAVNFTVYKTINLPIPIVLPVEFNIKPTIQVISNFISVLIYGSYINYLCFYDLNINNWIGWDNTSAPDFSTNSLNVGQNRFPYSSNIAVSKKYNLFSIANYLFSHCPKGTYYDIKIFDCSPIPSGYSKNTANVGYFTLSNPNPCNPGHYCPGSSPSIACQPGTYSLTTLNVNISSCLPIPPGFTCFGWSACSNLYPCEAGKYCPTTSLNPMIPSSGYYAPYTKMAQPLLCPAGYYCPCDGTYIYTDKYSCSNSYGTISPTICNIGNYCPIGSSAANPCPTGTYNNLQNSSSINDCIPCPIGTYNNIGTGTSQVCKTCPSGFYCPPGSFLPQICLANNYCPDGKYMVPCQIGTYFNGVGAKTNSSCQPCIEGTFCAGGGLSVQICAQGTYMPEKGSIACETCPEGHACPPGSITPTLCPRNTYAISGSSSCTNCLAGQYTDGPGEKACIICPSSQFSINGWWCMTIFEKMFFIAIWVGSISSGLITIWKLKVFYMNRRRKILESGLPITIKSFLFLEKIIKNNNFELTVREDDNQPILAEHNQEIKRLEELIICLQNEVKLLKNPNILYS